MNHRYSTYILILFLGIIGLGVVGAFLTSEDLDQVCSIENTVLYRNGTEWACGSLEDTVINYTINNITYLINNYTLYSNSSDFWDNLDSPSDIALMDLGDRIVDNSCIEYDGGGAGASAFVCAGTVGAESTIEYNGTTYYNAEANFWNQLYSGNAVSFLTLDSSNISIWSSRIGYSTPQTDLNIKLGYNLDGTEYGQDLVVLGSNETNGLFLTTVENEFFRINGTSGDANFVYNLTVQNSEVCTKDNNLCGLGDIFVNETGDTMTGQLIVQSGNGNIVSSNGAGAISAQTSGGNAGAISFGNTADIGISTDGTVDGYNYDGALIFKQKTSNPTEIGEFIFIEESGDWRFALPKSGSELGTYNPRSMIIAGPSTNNATAFNCTYWGFDSLDCNTGGTGADLGVQDDFQVLGDIYPDGGIIFNNTRMKENDGYLHINSTHTYELFGGIFNYVPSLEISDYKTSAMQGPIGPYIYADSQGVNPSTDTLYYKPLFLGNSLIVGDKEGRGSGSLTLANNLSNSASKTYQISVSDDGAFFNGGTSASVTFYFGALGGSNQNVSFEPQGGTPTYSWLRARTQNNIFTRSLAIADLNGNGKIWDISVDGTTTNFGNNVTISSPDGSIDRTSIDMLFSLTANSTIMPCTTGYEGGLYYDGNLKTHLGCNGSNWNALY